MRFNRSELASLATNSSTRFDKEGLLIITERQEGIFWRTDVKLECWCKLRGNLLFYLKDKNPKSSVAGVLVLQDCRPRIHHEQPELEGYVFDLDFKDSPSQRIVTHSAADRLDWVRSIEACSHQQIDLQIKQLEEQIAAATAAKRTAAAAIGIGIGTGTGTVMGNRIDQGLPLPTNMFPDSWPASASSATAEAPFEDLELSELPICETAISCDNLPLDSFGRPPNPRVICSVLQPGEDCLWRQHARTELLERERAPNFLCTMRFLRSAGFKASTRLRFSVHDVRERVSLTSLPLGHAEVALGVIQDATRLRLPLSSPRGECGFITLASWAPEAANELNPASGPERTTNGLTQPTPPRSSTQFFQPATDSSSSSKTTRQKGHRRTQSLPPKLGVRLFVPQQCGVGRVCVNPCQHSYRLHSSLGADISVLETLLESRLCCAVPQQLLSIWIQREKELLQEISGMGELSGEWRWRQMNLLEEHLRLLKDYSQAKQNIQQLMRDGVHYKRSAAKTDEALEFLPVNLHVQRMWAQNDALQRRGVLDIVTVGAFTRHDAKGRKCGGLIKLLQESKSWKLEQSNACKVQAANDAVQATKQLRKEIVELMSQLLQLASRRSARDMMPLCNEMVGKTRTLLNIWEPSIVEEAVTFIERHRIIEEPDNVLMEPMSPFRKITQQLSALELKSPELEDFATPVVAPPDLWPRGQPLMRSNSWHPSNSSPSSSLDINAIDTLQHVVKCYNAHLRSLEQHQAVPPQEPQCSELQAEATYQSLPPSWQGVPTESATALPPLQLIDLDERAQATQPPAGFLDTKLMSSSPSANYYRPTEEPEPLDLTQLNIEASVMCLVSKLKFFCGRCDSPAIRLRHPKVPLKREGFTVAPQQAPDVIAAPTAAPSQQLNLDLAPAPATASAPAAATKKGNKFTDGLDLSLTTDWVGELRPSMRKLRHAMDRLLKTARLMHSVQRLQQDVRCNRVQASIMYRRDVCFSQALTALVCALMLRLWGRELDSAYLSLLRELGPLAYFEGLLSLYGSETDMWSDMCIAIEDLSAVSFTLVLAAQGELTPMPRITGSRQALEVLLPVPEHVLPTTTISFKITPVFFNIGINEKATLGQTREQHRSNLDNYVRLSQYFSRYRKLGLNATGAADASSSEWESLQSLLGYMEQQLRANVSKNVKILHLAEDACRLMGGLRFTSCKSAKDRTGMAVTLEQCRVLVREFQLPAKHVPFALSTMRSEGTRIDNVYKNIGKYKYAFNLPQVIMLPAMYRPPVGAYGKAQT
ncbi:inositol polyphosphate-4-phosphatase type I A isoform X1 [Drosophila novamexicana]|uniref:inositol polyphosphate-4-phosphatase type I A isoform X1 n=1 Tax=Drosophila novamexicana TaxID=47314 RepID=UPI0011E5D82F|nr:inositol polyphosphate-4-phosphatase type I A isoform X1 [Drosophila novamexicana]